MRSRFKLSLAAILIAGFVAAACGASADEKAPAGGRSIRTAAHISRKGEVGQAIWVINSSLVGSTVSRIEPESNQLTAQIALEGAPRGIAAGEGALWISDYANDKVLRIDPGSGRIIASLDVAKAPTALAAGNGAVWVISSNEGKLSRIDPQTNEVTAVIPVTNSLLTDVAYGAQAVWVTSVDFTVSRIDPKANEVAATIRVIGNPAAVRFGDGSVWVSNATDATLLRIDPDSNQVVAKIKAPAPLLHITPGNGALWAADRDGSLFRIDVGGAAGTAKIAETIKLARDCRGLIFAAGSLWFSSRSENKLLRVDPVSKQIIASVDIEGGPAASVSYP